MVSEPRNHKYLGVSPQAFLPHSQYKGNDLHRSRHAWSQAGSCLKGTFFEMYTWPEALHDYAFPLLPLMRPGLQSSSGGSHHAVGGPFLAKEDLVSSAAQTLSQL